MVSFSGAAGGDLIDAREGDTLSKLAALRFCNSIFQSGTADAVVEAEGEPVEEVGDADERAGEMTDVSFCDFTGTEEVVALTAGVDVAGDSPVVELLLAAADEADATEDEVVELALVELLEGTVVAFDEGPTLSILLASEILTLDSNDLDSGRGSIEVC